MKPVRERLIRRLRPARKDAPAPVFSLEPLEPRLLLSADPLGGAVAADPTSLIDPHAGEPDLDDAQVAEQLFNAIDAGQTPTAPAAGEPATADEIQLTPLDLAGLDRLLPGDNEPGDTRDPVNLLDSLATLQAGDSTDAPARREVIFVDASVEDRETLLAGIDQSDPDTQYLVILLEADVDGVGQISATLAGLSDVDAVHLVSHGDAQGIRLGGSWLTAETLAVYQAEVDGWRRALDTDADLLIYGCDLAGNRDGVQLLEALGQLTGADIAASDDLTGNAANGGDWELEYQLGDVATPLAFTQQAQQQWQGVLYYLDQFITSGSFAGDDGTQTWTNDWQEIGEANGANFGNVSVWTNLGQQGLLLWAADNFGAWRQADLSGATTATLSFDWAMFMTEAGDRASLQISTDGVAWDTLAAFDGPLDHSAMQSAVYDISDYIDNDTQIRFETISGFSSNDEFFVDNVRIDMDVEVPLTTFVVTNTNAGGMGSLEWAINQANAHNGPNTITFSIAGAGPHVINVDADGLPHIDDTVFIDGWSEPDYADDGVPVIQIDGGGPGAFDGLRLAAGSDGSTIRGLSITNFSSQDAIDIDSSSNFILGNSLGIAPDGTTVGGNDTGITMHLGASDNQIGDTGTHEGNLISANTYAGVVIKDSGTDDNRVVGNAIGLDGTGAVVNVGSRGVVLWDDPDGNRIGGVLPGEGNQIAGFNIGVLVDSNFTPTTDTAILGNQIWGNSQYGIDLENEGITPNDADDLDGGSNDLLNYPVLSNVANNGADLDINFDLDVPAGNYRIEFFENPGGINASRFGGGEVFLGAATVPSTGTGMQSFAATLIGVNASDIYTVTATATEDLGLGNYGSTSEFSRAFPNAILTPAKDTYLDKGSNGSNYGISPDLVVDQSGGELGDVRTLLQFDLTGLPAGATITSATLQLQASANSGAFDINVYRVTDAWDEGVENGSGDAASWNDRQDSTPWVNINGGGDVDLTIIDTLNTSAMGQHTWDVTSLAVDWYNTPATNFGLLLGNPNTGTEAVTYDSSEGTTAPQLLITYTVTNNAPVFVGSGPFAVDENAAAATVVGDIDANDGDGGATDVGITYDITGNLDPDGDTNDAFAIDPVTGVITVNDQDDLDYEDSSSMVITVEADDGVDTASTGVTIAINDIAPVLSASGNSTVKAGEAYTLNLSAVEPGLGDISSWTIDWGDGTTQLIPGNPSTATHTYSNTGFTNNILVAVTDSGGNTTLAGDLLSTSLQNDRLYRFDANDPLINSWDDLPGPGNSPVDVQVGPDGETYVTGFGTNKIFRYNADGTFDTTFVDGNGLNGPSHIAFGPDGNLYVTNLNNDRVLRFSGVDGTSNGTAMGPFISAGLDQPDGIAFGPDGDLYVANIGTGDVLRFDGVTGVYDPTFLANGPSGFLGYMDIDFGPDGRLWVTNQWSDDMRRYSATDGSYFDTFATTGATDFAGIAFGPDGYVYMSDAMAEDKIIRYPVGDGSAPEPVVASNLGGLDRPVNIVFTPAQQVLVTPDSAPVFEASGPFSLDENSPAATVVGDIDANDGDGGGTDVGITYDITTNLDTDGDRRQAFAIDAATGVISVNDPGDLDFETADPMVITVEADDGGLQSTTPVTINLNNVNEAPTINSPSLVFINEIHYDNVGIDSGEGVEIAGVEGNELDGWTLALYNGFDGSLYDMIKLWGTIPDEGDGFGTLSFSFPTDGIQNATSGNPDGLALMDPDGTVVQFLSYEGAFTATDGPANGMLSTDIGVSEDNASTSVGHSLQLTGPGPAFSWMAASANTFGSINTGQDFAAVSAGSRQLVVEDGNLLFSIGNGNAFIIADVDAALGIDPDPLSVTLGVSNGTLTLGSTTGLGSESGNTTNSVTFTGTVAEVNAALEGLSYQPDPGYNGVDKLTLVVDDQGNAGSGGAQTTGASVYIQVTPTNDAPVLDNTGTMALRTISQDNANPLGERVDDLILSAGGNRITDADAADPEGIAVIGVDNSDGTWEYSLDDGDSWTSFVVSGVANGSTDDTAAVLLDEAARIRFVPDPGHSGSGGNLSFQAWDQTTGSVGQTGVDVSINGTSTAFSVDVETATVSVTAAAGISNTVPGAQGGTEDTPLVFSVADLNPVTVSDGSGSDAMLRVTLSSTNGTLTLSGTGGLNFLSGADGSASMTFIGLESAINAALDGLTYDPTTGYSGAADVQITTEHAADLEGLYSFDDPATPVTLGNNDAPDGGPNATVSGVTGVADGFRGQVASFGSGDSAEITGQFSNPADVTLAAWVNLTDGAGDAEVISIGDRVILRLDMGFSSLGVFGSFNNGSGYDVTSDGIFINGTGWHHVAYTIDDTNNAQRLYIDGQLVASTSHSASIAYGGGLNTTIGSHANTSSFFMDGLIDDARIYSRALSAGEINALFSDTLSATSNVAITIAAGNSDPTLDNAIGDQSATEDSAFSFTFALNTFGDVDGDTLTYTAQLSGGGALPGWLTFDGATRTFSGTPANGDVGTVSIDVIADDGNGGATASDTFDIAVGNSNDAPTGSVLIDNITPAEGAVLNVSNTLADDDGLSGPITYQWYSGATALIGETGTSYTTVAADVGQVISVVASYTDDRGTPEQVSSADTAPVTNINDSPTGSVAISGTPAEDQVLTASNTLADADGIGTIAYQWQRNGTDIGGASGNSYTLVQGDVGKTITVVASYTDGGGTDEQVSSSGLGPVANVNDLPGGAVTISNMSPTRGDTLLAANSLADEDGLGPITYQWLRDGAAISGATGTAYTTGVDDVGGVISVVASYTDAYGTDETMSSANTGTVADVVPPPPVVTVPPPVVTTPPVEETPPPPEEVTPPPEEVISPPEEVIPPPEAVSPPPEPVIPTPVDPVAPPAKPLSPPIGALPPVIATTPDPVLPDSSIDDNNDSDFGSDIDKEVEETVAEESQDSSEGELIASEAIDDTRVVFGGGSVANDPERALFDRTDGDGLTHISTVFGDSSNLSSSITTVTRDDDLGFAATLEGPTLGSLFTTFSTFIDPMMLIDAEGFSQSLDEMRQDLQDGIEINHTVLGGTVSLTAGLSMGYMVWLARSGILLSSALSALPAWRFMDPLPVLATGSRQSDDEEDAESLESIIEESPAGEDEPADNPLPEEERREDDPLY